VRAALLYNPRLLCERLAVASTRRRRLQRLRNTAASGLSLGHIESLELLDLANAIGMDVVYDVGANVGTWTLLALATNPHVRVEAFEPLPQHHAGFARNVNGAPAVTLHPIALGSANGTAAMHVTDYSDASSLLPLADASRVDFQLEEISQVDVSVRRLDDYRAERGLPPPDLIKLDVQGYELEVLKGAPECLRTAKVVLSEVSFLEYYHGQCLFHDLVAYLAGFDLLVSAFGVNTPTGAAANQTDVLFVRRNLIRRAGGHQD